MQAEFRMITDIAEAAPKELLFNYDELKAFLTEALRDYKTLVVTEDAIADAKEIRAKLNKLSDNINAYRINVKKRIMEQYDSDFKPKCDELVAMIREAVDNISSQTKAFEDKEAAAKVEQLRKFYETAIGAQDKLIRSCLPWEFVENPKWRNKTFPIEAAMKEIMDAIKRVAADIAAIRDMGARDPAYLFDYYRETHNLALVLKKASELDHIRQLESEKEREVQKDEERIGGPIEVVTVSFSVTCSKKKLQALAEYMRLSGITYGRVK